MRILIHRQSWLGSYPEIDSGIGSDFFEFTDEEFDELVEGWTCDELDAYFAEARYMAGQIQDVRSPTVSITAIRGSNVNVGTAEALDQLAVDGKKLYDEMKRRRCPRPSDAEALAVLQRARYIRLQAMRKQAKEDEF